MAPDAKHTTGINVFLATVRVIGYAFWAAGCCARTGHAEGNSIFVKGFAADYYL